MKCEQVQELLTGLLLGDLDEATRAEVERHLEECEGCRAQRRELELTLDLVRDALSASSSEAAIPQHLTPARRALITSTPPARRPIPVLNWFATPHPKFAMAAAACIVLALVVAGLMMAPLVSSSREKARKTAELRPLCLSDDATTAAPATKTAPAPKSLAATDGIADGDEVVEWEEAGVAAAGEGGGGGGRMVRRTKARKLPERAAAAETLKEVRGETEQAYKTDTYLSRVASGRMGVGGAADRSMAKPEPDGTGLSGDNARLGKMGPGGFDYYKAKVSGAPARPAAPPAVAAPPPPPPPVPQATTLAPGAETWGEKPDESRILLVGEPTSEGDHKKQLKGREGAGNGANFTVGISTDPKDDKLSANGGSLSARGIAVSDGTPAASKPFSAAAPRQRTEAKSVRQGVAADEEAQRERSVLQDRSKDGRDGTPKLDLDVSSVRSDSELRSRRKTPAAPDAPVVGRLFRQEQQEQQVGADLEVGARAKGPARDNATITPAEAHRRLEAMGERIDGVAAVRSPAAEKERAEEVTRLREIIREDNGKVAEKRASVPGDAAWKAEAWTTIDSKDKAVNERAEGTKKAVQFGDAGKSKGELADAASAPAPAAPPAKVEEEVTRESGGKAMAGRATSTYSRAPAARTPGSADEEGAKASSGHFLNPIALRRVVVEGAQKRQTQPQPEKPAASGQSESGEGRALSKNTSLDGGAAGPGFGDKLAAEKKEGDRAEQNRPTAHDEKTLSSAKAGDASAEPVKGLNRREQMERTYEGWWREASYYRATATNALNVNGFVLDGRVVAGVQTPSAGVNTGLTHMESNVVGRVVGTSTKDNLCKGTLDPRPIGGRALTIRVGNRLLTDKTGDGKLTGDGVGTVNHDTGVYSFKLNEATPEGTAIEAFYTTAIPVYVFPVVLPKGPEPKDLPAKFRAFGVNPVVECASQPFSTFSIDVDTASYTVSRNYMLRGQRPPAEAVRTEEFVNFFDYAYAAPTRETFKVYAEAAPSKFGRGMQLLKIGVKGKRLGREEQRGAILTFLVDTSGSMDKPDRIGLIRKSLKMLLDKLGPQDQVAIVQFDSNVRLALDHTPAAEKEKIAGVLDSLQCSGSTHLEGGMIRAYEVAARSFRANAENRVLILSDGVANLGTMGAEDILARVEAYRKQGIYCSVFGFGIGTFDDTMLQTLADKGNGAYAFIDSETEAKRVFVDDLAATLNTIAADVKIQVEFNPKRVAKYRQIGYEKRQLKKEDFRNDTVDAGEVGSGQSVTALYEVELRDSRDPLGTVRLRYRRTDNNRVEEIERAVTSADLKQDFDKTDARFRLAACVAEFSEQLRGSPYAAGTDFADVASALRPVALEMPLDTQVQELLRLVQSAGSLSLAAP